MRRSARPERPTPSRRDEPSRSSAVSRRLTVIASCFGVVIGAYVAQKLQAPLGLDGHRDVAVFWMFSLVVMALLASLFIAGVKLARRVRTR
jgi:hypothetical protein